MDYFNRLSCMMLIASACTFFAGCLAIVSPVPTPTRVKNVNGGRMPKRLGIRSIRPGSTHRDEVLQKIGWADTGLHSKRLFLARWKVSHMAVCWAGVGEGDADADCRSVWQAHSLMVEFDGQGIVRNIRPVGDHDIGKVLSAWLATDPEPPLVLSKPLVVPAVKGRNSAKLTLAKTFLAYQYKAKTLRIPRRQILAVHTLGWKGHAHYIKVEIQYRGETKAARKLRFRLFPSNLLTLIEYLEQTHAQGTPDARYSGDRLEVSRGK